MAAGPLPCTPIGLLPCTGPPIGALPCTPSGPWHVRPPPSLDRVMAATLLAVAHGTADPAGQAEIRHLVDLVRARRPSTAVELGWLERASPSAADVLGRLTGPVVVLPVLLSTGYHVKVDIQRLADGRPRTAVAAQLGPDRRLVEVVRQRLLGGRTPGADVVLFGAGSSDPEAFEQLTEAAAGLRSALTSTEGTRARRPPPVPHRHRRLAGRPGPRLRRRQLPAGARRVQRPAACSRRGVGGRFRGTADRRAPADRRADLGPLRPGGRRAGARLPRSGTARVDCFKPAGSLGERHGQVAQLVRATA